jgi:dienelactone hydrolase
MRLLAVLTLLCLTIAVRADGPGDNVADSVRPVPPKGSEIPAADRESLTKELDLLGKEIQALKKSLELNPALLELLPDVEIYHKAVRYALEYDEFYIEKDKKDKVIRDDVKVAASQLKIGLERAKELRLGKPSWPTETGLVVRGYRSKIDGSVQPYGLVIPSTYSPVGGGRFRLDFWWHGRGEKLTEVNFLDERNRSPGQFTPRNTIVLHPYGRYCNANKFAGEIDSLEALEHVKKHYSIDNYRIVARGFSMGGAACWQFATHYPSLFAAAAPGAGFSETPEFLNVFQNEKVSPAWYEKKLWGMYNATDYAVNLNNLPVVAYSGEVDKQKQAADVMARELEKEEIELVHIIGPKTGHSYHPESKKEVNRLIDAHAQMGRGGFPYSVKFTTPTLRYNRSAWLKVTGLERHWDFGRITGAIIGVGIHVRTKGITSFMIDIPGEEVWVGVLNFPLSITVDDEQFTLTKRRSDRSIRVEFQKQDDKWDFLTPDAKPKGLRKIPGLQGPIDDAFMDSFLMVKPTGKPLNEKVGKWVDSEMKHAVKHWRQQFRGDAPIKTDREISEADIANNNLVLWGDPSSNAVMAKVMGKLPVQWTEKLVKLGESSHAAENHVLVLIFPNPLNPAKYVVLNSGFTFREYDYLNNARQVPKLPDYAIVDVNTPPSSRYPGKIVQAGFFGESWEVQAKDGQ